MEYITTFYGERIDKMSHADLQAAFIKLSNMYMDATGNYEWKSPIILKELEEISPSPGLTNAERDAIIRPKPESVWPNFGQTPPYNTDNSGCKDDASKPRLDLIAPELLHELGLVLDFGANKYSARNWEKGMSWGRCFAAAMRHLWVWWGGQENDPETSFSHLSHAACCVMFLLAYSKRSVGADDRMKLTPPDTLSPLARAYDDYLNARITHIQLTESVKKHLGH